MSINIAFNTIIYIMVFLFPGILFRRTFFSGNFKSLFDTNSKLERFVWNILFSLVCLSLFCGLSVLIDAYTNNKFSGLYDINSQEILDNLILLYNSKFPTIFKNTQKLLSISFALVSVYIYSGMLGYFLNRVIFIFGFEKRYSIFRFQNNWDYLTKSNRQNNINHKLGDIHYTKVDIKTKESELFTGRLHEILFDKDGKIEAVAIQNAYKFIKINIKEENSKYLEVKKQLSINNAMIIKHSESNEEFIFRKRIKGNIFTIPNENIYNISITYINISNSIKKLQNYSKYVISLTILLITLFSLSYLIWDFDIFDFTTYYKRIGFCLSTPIISLFILTFFIQLLNFKSFKEDLKNYLIGLKDAIFLTAYVSLTYLYVFDVVKFKTIIIILVMGFFCIPLFINTKKNDENN